MLQLLLAWGTPNLAVSGEQKDCVYLFITAIIINTYWLCILEEEKKDIVENILLFSPNEAETYTSQTQGIGTINSCCWL